MLQETTLRNASFKTVIKDEGERERINGFYRFNLMDGILNPDDITRFIARCESTFGDYEIFYIASDKLAAGDIAADFARYHKKDIDGGIRRGIRPRMREVGRLKETLKVPRGSGQVIIVLLPGVDENVFLEQVSVMKQLDRTHVTVIGLDNDIGIGKMQPTLKKDIREMNTTDSIKKKYGRKNTLDTLLHVKRELENYDVIDRLDYEDYKNALIELTGEREVSGRIAARWEKEIRRGMDYSEGNLSFSSFTELMVHYIRLYEGLTAEERMLHSDLEELYVLLLGTGMVYGITPDDSRTPVEFRNLLSRLALLREDHIGAYTRIPDSVRKRFSKDYAPGIKSLGDDDFQRVLYRLMREDGFYRLKDLETKRDFTRELILLVTSIAASEPESVSLISDGGAHFEGFRDELYKILREGK